MIETSPKRERRRHIMYVTRNTEYHCRDRECVGVRDRNTRRWQRWHPALRTRLLGTMVDREKVVRSANQGNKLIFSAGSDEKILMTSSLLGAGRPPLEAVDNYANLCWAGTIAS